ncbi:hypothetical protein E2562_020869 [Oryza meyeriana var. granulata]|uniref:Uncharacterized protein n=1 Tax=Oryza meyeriana var. granulata TaxID=110450 RepID=A0A6G1D4K8_9ORYZ|nr:hypothetical protein E2562_020869 [Oryza meyeriana var. granulata]
MLEGRTVRRVERPERRAELSEAQSAEEPSLWTETRATGEPSCQAAATIGPGRRGALLVGGSRRSRRWRPAMGGGDEGSDTGGAARAFLPLPL